ncbi:hypothetical protein IAQ61_005114 [Plenodomus lingam]|uniref:uncharacterized protein n=1 Tax=Leptosphaeria maculans TaxID=5022 RepID=UPI0033293DA0|nr:hypothetical protein IAQ61_005114 [Plenodomus lingam]
MLEHRLPPRKSCAIDQDANIPFLVRGPGVPRNRSAWTPSSHADVVPTVFERAEVQPRGGLDGELIAVRVVEDGGGVEQRRGEGG